MTQAADLVLRNAEVHALTDPDRVAEAVAVRDGRIVRVGDDYEVDFLAGVETTELDLHGRVLLPGFVDAHTHMRIEGWRATRTDLADADGPDAVVSAMRDADPGPEGWLLGFGMDDGDWDAALTRADLDAVSEERPVAVFREDLHAGVVNSVALDGHRGEMPDEDVVTEDGAPTGLVVEDARKPIFGAIDPGREGTRDLLRAARDRAHRRGVTGVHDFVRFSRAPAAYRDLARDGELALDVRVCYWADHLDAAVEMGLHTNHGDEVRVGAIKAYTDGSIASHTARLGESYADADTRGEWVRDPDAARDLAERADDEGFQVAFHAVGDAAVEAALDALAATENPREARHRVEHATLATDDQMARAVEAGAVVCLQPNFHRWGGPDGEYAARLGDRWERANRLAAWHEAGATLAFGSDCMPFDPLLGVDYAVDPPAGDGLDVTTALRAYTRGSAYAGFAEDETGTVERGKRANLVALDGSPWTADDVSALDVDLTVHRGEIVYDGR
ncbi:MAG: amidohydrolase [Halobacteriaceae archaeon]